MSKHDSDFRFCSTLSLSEGESPATHERHEAEHGYGAFAPWVCGRLRSDCSKHRPSPPVGKWGVRALYETFADSAADRRHGIATLHQPDSVARTACFYRRKGCRHYPGAASGRITSLISSRRISLPRKGCRVGLRIVLFEACSAFTRVAACTLALSPIRDTLIEGFSHFVTSMTAPIASGWSGCRVGLAPTGKRRLVTAHTRSGHSNDDTLTSKGKNFSTGTRASFEDRCVHLGGEFFADKGLLDYSGFVNFRQD